MYKIALICGSLRKASTNAGILRALTETKDERFIFQWINIHQFPVFNEDIEANGIPIAVQKARDIVAHSDAVIFGVPQYNFTIAAPMKNAYDWLSRDDKNKFCPMTQKIGAMTSSGGNMGGGRAQAHLRQSVGFRKMKILQPSKQAQIMIQRFSGRFFDQNGNLVDESYRKRLHLFLNQFHTFIKANKK